jgi:uncharacterized protein (DUF2236 family)
MMVRRVQEVFNDQDRGDRPVVRSADALHPSTSVIWRVHGDVATMMIGGMTALLLQIRCREAAPRPRNCL